MWALRSLTVVWDADITDVKRESHRTGVERTLSLAVIIKNEADMIAELVDTHLTFVDELLIVDTGSTDVGPQKARERGARVEKIDWPGSFAEARNRAIELCQNEWVLMLDADERLDLLGQAEVRRQVSECEEKTVFRLVQRTYTNDAEVLGWRPTSRGSVDCRGAAGYYDVALVRLFPKRPELRFEGIIHELIEPSARRARNRIQDTSIVLHHYKEHQSPSKKSAKNQFYLDLSRRKYEANPGDPQAQLELAMAASACGLYQEVVSLLIPAVRMFPKSLPLAQHLGVALCRCGRFDEVEPALSRSLELHEHKSAELLELMGEAQTKLGKNHKAVELLSRALEVNPRSFRALINLGVAHLGLQNIGAAEQSFVRAQELNPMADLPLINMALCQKRRGLVRDAESSLNRALELNPGRWQSYAQKALLAFERGAYLDSARYAAQARGIDGCGAEAYIRSCAAALALGQTRAALGFAERAAELDPRYQYIVVEVQKELGAPAKTTIPRGAP